MQDAYLKDLTRKFGQAKSSLDDMLQEGTTKINGDMMALGVGLA